MSGAPDGTARTASRPSPVVPPEVQRFFLAPQPRTLTVRGDPGAGKTSFALAALAAFPGFRAFVSTTVDRASLRVGFPWLSDAHVPRVELLDFLRFRTPEMDSAVNVSEMRNALQARASDLVDVASVLSLPPVLHELLSAHAGEPKMVAIDSWDAWIANLLGPSPLATDVPTVRWELERAILGQLLRAGAHVLMVVERSEPNRFDYVADGLVALSAAEFEGRQERWISLVKLRGTEIDSPSYPFTLEGAQFHCLLPPRPPAPPYRLGDEPDPNPSDPSLWPGSSAFAQWFGRIPPVGYVLLETDSETPVLFLWRLAAPAILSALRDGGRVLVRPPGSLTPTGLRENFVPALASADALDRLGIVVPTPPSRESEGFVLARLSPTGEFVLPPSETVVPPAERSGRGSAVGFLTVPPATPTRHLVVTFPDAEVDLSQESPRTDPFLGVPAEARRAGSRFGALVVMHSDDPQIEPVRVRSAVHIAARTRHGQFFVYGVRPWTPFLATVTPPDPRGAPTYGFIPVV